ncbi:unnamed protein product [Parascedosporium putredinis]|uniref:Fe2OG dioxygenase domain-containing protein n=1 Tax=Parascedosporium putredinis TaxID=1442378 RepID=A0A9P1MB45_9PEZI|nr:unnamed protein product [Parascedosporium putredinis]CAI7995285.1 unnamed protein product [Parascedosporium putredinis]
MTLLDGSLHVSSTNDDFVERAAKLAAGFRDTGVVIWVQTVFEKPRQFVEGQQIITRDVPLPPSAAVTIKPGKDSDIDVEAFLSTTPITCVQKGTPGWQLASPLKKVVDPRKDVLLMKTQYSAFNGTRLLQILRSRLVTTLYVCGSLINVGVHATTVDAAAHGYSITLVRDCCGWSNKERREAALSNLEEVSGCDIVKARSVVATLGEPDDSDDERERQKKKDAEQKAEKARIKAARRDRGKKDEDDNVKKDTKGAGDPKPIEAKSETASKPPVTAPQEPSGAKEPSKPRPRPSESGASSKLLELQQKYARTRSIQPRTLAGSESLSLEVDSDLEAASDDGDDSDGELRRNLERIVASRSRTTGGARSREAVEGVRRITRDVKALRLSSPARSPPRDRIATPAKSTTAEEMPAAQIKSDDAPSNPPEAKEAVKSHAEAVPEDRGDATESAPKESEPLCEGDTKVIYNVLPSELEEGIYEKLKDEIDWKRMSHLGGEVPRLVAVQGHVEADGSMPVYRHPADESPLEALFSYRASSERRDYISEHSDKTLDIVKGSYIANLSLGAERTMVFRTKRADKEPKPTAEPDSGSASPPTSTTTITPSSSSPPLQRQSQRARLPHNSLCRMGLATNERWLHAIKQDKRREAEKTPEEKSFGGGRISLTFRNIGTFLDAGETRIWGQGATAKAKEDARPVVNGDEAASEAS